MASAPAPLPRLLRVAAPVLVGLLVLSAWELGVRLRAVPVYVLPGPLLVARTLATDLQSLWPAWLFTLRITALALVGAAVLGGLLAIVLAQARWIEAAFFPYAVMLQVTPIVSIAPLIIIWIDETFLALLACAWIVAFFPVLSNTTLGLRSIEPNLADLFRLYGASRWQTLLLLRLPSALPYFLAGLRISGGLALVGAVVAEFVAGTGGTETGLAFRILEAGYRLQIPRMFAALLLLSLSGVSIFALLSALSNALLRHWHASALPRER
jgi:NitT/TauT family transport system permease protein